MEKQLFQSVTVTVMNSIAIMLEELEKAGLKASGVNPDTGLVEIVEIRKSSVFYWSAIPSRI